MKPRLYCIADVHGKFDNLIKLIKLIRDDGGLNFKNGDKLIQLGDRCDRGNDSYRVNNFFYKLQKRYPDQVICIYGNHEDLMINAAINPNHELSLFEMNGGDSTIKAYSKVTGWYSRYNLGDSLKQANHLFWTEQQPLYYETDEYFFCHAPIPKEGMGARKKGVDFRDVPEVLYWSYGGEKLEDWVDPEAVPGKISVHGHIHSLKRNSQGEYHSPGIRQIGNSFIIDTGSGCSKHGYLTCLELTEMKVYTSRGEILIGEYETI